MQNRREFFKGLCGTLAVMLGLTATRTMGYVESKLVKFTVHNFSSPPPFPKSLRSPDGWVCVWETMTVPRSRKVTYHGSEVDLYSADETWCYEMEVIDAKA